MRVRLVGDNARYLAPRWYECHLVDTSDNLPLRQASTLANTVMISLPGVKR